MAKYRGDPSPLKVDLGVGVYRDLSGNTPVLACVRRAEQAVLSAQNTKSYVAAAGRAEFNSAVEEMVLGPAHAARRDRRARTAQTPGGCGALRVGAELIRAAVPAVTVHISDPTWGTPRRYGSHQRSDVGQSHALVGQFGPPARTLPLLRYGRAPAALRRHAR